MDSPRAQRAVGYDNNGRWWTSRSPTDVVNGFVSPSGCLSRLAVRRPIPGAGMPRSGVGLDAERPSNPQPRWQGGSEECLVSSGLTRARPIWGGLASRQDPAGPYPHSPATPTRTGSRAGR